MLSSTLFSKFPSIGYNGEIITNITVRVKFQKMAEDNMMVFYPYTIEEGERADVIAHNYYGDASYTWLIYLANNITDPAHEWPKTEEQMKKYLTSTYGSVEAAYEKIMFYRVDWVSDDSMINPSAYASMPSGNKKYWVPNYGPKRNITHYERARVDWVVDTNRIVKLTTPGVTSVVDEQTVRQLDLVEGDIVYQMTNGIKSASGEITLIESNNSHFTVYVKNITGAFVDANKTLYKNEASVGVCSAAVIVQDSLTPEEANYWAPVTAYDYEVELNEAKKNIRLIDSSYLDTIERDIRLIVAE